MTGVVVVAGVAVIAQVAMWRFYEQKIRDLKCALTMRRELLGENEIWTSTNPAITTTGIGPITHGVLYTGTQSVPFTLPTATPTTVAGDTIKFSFNMRVV